MRHLLHYSTQYITFYRGRFICTKNQSLLSHFWCFSSLLSVCFGAASGWLYGSAFGNSLQKGLTVLLTHKHFSAKAANITVKAVAAFGLHWTSRKRAALYLKR